MGWSSIPNFEDKHAKIRERKHSSGASIIEVLYDARDNNGNPTSPESTSDGHGHWIALEIDGIYQMLSWRHSALEGGRQEYGLGRSSNALADLEQDISAKENICNRAESLAYSQDWKNASSEFIQLSKEWKNIFDWGTPKEKELQDRFQTAKRSFYERRDGDRARNKAAKQGIISEAVSISNSNDWKNTGDKFKELFKKWKNIGSAGKTDDDVLWAEFNSARQFFFDRRLKHYSEMDAQRVKNRQAKQALISEARNVAQYSTEWKSTGDRLNEIMTHWKSIGSAGKDYDESLWNEFNEIRQDFFKRRHIHYEEKSRTYQENAARKGWLVQEAVSIANRYDYSAQSTERMKELDKEWKSIGWAGKDNEDRLWGLFRDAKESFWSGKRSYIEQRQQEWRSRLYEAINRKRDQISNLQRQISELQYKMSGMRNQDYIDNMCRWIDEKEAKIRDLEMAISDMESKL